MFEQMRAEGPGMTGAAVRGGAGRRWPPLIRRRRSARRYRRLAAAACAAGCAGIAVHHLAPVPSATDTVLVAARDLPAGRVLQPGDLQPARWPLSARPDATVARPEGRTLASPLRRGEPVTDARLTGPGLLAGQPAGTVAITVRLTDPGAARLLSAGDRVDLLAGPVGRAGADEAGGEAELLARSVLVLAAPGSSTNPAANGPGEGVGRGDGSGSGGAGGETGLGGSLLGDPTAGASGSGSDDAGLLVVAVDRQQATRLAAAGGARSITAALTGSGDDLGRR